jgi:streptomycin 6-kinase
MLPEPFVRTIKGVHQERGEIWLQQFGQLVTYCETRWSCKLLEPFKLSYNYVAPVRMEDGTEAVIKLGVPSKEITTELTALRLYNANGAVKVLDSDEERGIMLLERIYPGQTLNTVGDEEKEALHAAAVMRKLRAPVPIGVKLPSVADWAQGLTKLRNRFDGGTGPLSERLVCKAEAAYASLIPSMRNVELLHGDLHHENILSAEREPWIAIDPKGLIGEPEYQVIQFLLNHMPKLNPTAALERRVDIFTEELKLDKKRLLSWAMCHSVLSSWWSLEDNTDGAMESMEMAERFETLLE